jgi:hypothetical protein
MRNGRQAGDRFGYFSEMTNRCDPTVCPPWYPTTRRPTARQRLASPPDLAASVAQKSLGDLARNLGKRCAYYADCILILGWERDAGLFGFTSRSNFRLERIEGVRAG